MIFSHSLSVVVPVYNGAQSLPELVERIAAVLSPLTPTFEIILVNDSSRDNSWEVITRLATQNSRVRGINLMRNFGQHNALLVGIRTAANDVIITMDDDLQHPPEEIPKLLAVLQEGYDVVYGVPIHAEQAAIKNLGSVTIKWLLSSTMGVKAAPSISAFRVFRTHLREAFAHYDSSYVLIDALLAWGTTKLGQVKVEHRARPYGTTNYTLRTNIRHAINMITGFSVLPLRIASFLGFLFMLFGIGVVSFVMWNYLVHGVAVPGFTFLAAALALFSGVQLFSLGIIGEYVARIHLRNMRKPYAVVKECIGFSGG